MPTPEQLGPLAAHLVSGDFGTCRGQVLFTAGSEIAVIDGPRLLEVIPTTTGSPLAAVLEAVTPVALVPAELHQTSRGGTNPRFAAIFQGSFDGRNVAMASSSARSCAVVLDRPGVRDAVVEALESRGVACRRVAAESVESAFDDTAVDAVVVALERVAPADAADGGANSDWQRVLGEHSGIVDGIAADAAAARAVADFSERVDRPIRVVTLTDATTAGGRSRAQASAQLSRASLGATAGRVAAFAVSIESSHERALRATAELTAHLVCSSESLALSGAELMVGDATIGLRSHPHVGTAVTFGAAAVPTWFDDVLGSVVR